MSLLSFQILYLKFIFRISRESIILHSEIFSHYIFIFFAIQSIFPSRIPLLTCQVSWFHRPTLLFFFFFFFTILIFLYFNSENYMCYFYQTLQATKSDLKSSRFFLSFICHIVWLENPHFNFRKSLCVCLLLLIINICSFLFIVKNKKFKSRHSHNTREMKILIKEQLLGNNLKIQEKQIIFLAN